MVLLDNASWMRVGELFEALDTEDGDPPTCKRKWKEVQKFVIADLAIGIMYGVISNKPSNQYLKILAVFCYR